MTHIQITLLGGFAVSVDGRVVPPAAWARRQATHLVKLLALAPRHQLHREQVMDALWPDVDPLDAAPRLHKAAHYARRALGVPDAVVLAGETVQLAPGARIEVDALELALAAARAGDHPGALRWLERLERAVRRELGAGPSREVVTLRRAILARLPRPEPAGTGTDEPSGAAGADQPAHDAGSGAAGVAGALVGRDAELRRLDDVLDDVARGTGQVLFVSGPPGVGTTSLLLALEQAARRRGFLVGTGVAARTEGAWPYAAVLEALSDLCCRTPEVLDRLGTHARAELQRALAGGDLEWDGANTHQRLYVAAAELLALCAADHGVLLVVDDADEADDATIRLLHYLARASAGARVLVAVGHEQGASGALGRARASLLARRQARTLDLSPLDRASAERLVARRVADPALVAAICDAADGVPLTLEEAARAAARGGADPLRAAVLPPDAPPDVLDTLAAVALLGQEFDADELAAAADVDEDAASAVLVEAVRRGLVARIETGARIRHAVVREALVARLDAATRRAVHLRAARALEAVPGAAARVAHHLRAAGGAQAAVPWTLRAAEAHAAVGAYRDALAELDRVRDAAAGDQLARLLALRADLLAASGDPAAPDAYREALAVVTDVATATRLRVRLAKVSVAAFDLVTFDGLIAHMRGEWFPRLQAALHRGIERPELVGGIFDSHLCVAEYLLYGPTPYEEVLELARALRTSAERAGVRRVVAFATALEGEAALLAGHLDEAGRALEQAAEMHRRAGSMVGEAHSLQRLAEVRLADGDPATARGLLTRALPLARWTMLAPCLLPRVYGSRIVAAGDDARTVGARRRGRPRRRTPSRRGGRADRDAVAQPRLGGRRPGGARPRRRRRGPDRRGGRPVAAGDGGLHAGRPAAGRAAVPVSR